MFARKNDNAMTSYNPFRMMDDLERSFRQKQDVLLIEDRTDLDVEIEVLRDRLQQEGLVARKGD